MNLLCKLDAGLLSPPYRVNTIPCLYAFPTSRKKGKAGNEKPLEFTTTHWISQKVCKKPHIFHRFVELYLLVPVYIIRLVEHTTTDLKCKRSIYIVNIQFRCLDRRTHENNCLLTVFVGTKWILPRFVAISDRVHSKDWKSGRKDLTPRPTFLPPPPHINNLVEL